MESPNASTQSGDDVLEVVQDTSGLMWRICTGGVCLTDYSGKRLLQRYQALLIDQGKEMPAWLQEAQR
jgi:hypothetical protein